MEKFIKLDINNNIKDVDNCITLPVSISKGISVIVNAKDNHKVNSYLFDINKWNEGDAKQWLKQLETDKYMPIDLEGKKLIEMQDIKATDKDGFLYIEGYANVKNVKDRYGDVPTVFTALRDYVYNVTEFKKNPVMMLNHSYDTSSMAGSFVHIEEDSKGLFVVGKYTNSEYAPVKHAKQLITEGHLKTFSIGGRFYWEDKDNSDHLTLADIHETSIVAIPACTQAEFDTIKGLNIGKEKDIISAVIRKGYAEDKTKSTEGLKEIDDTIEMLKSTNEILRRELL
ncbi:HK97 family phage prohead protease [Patescibacteria group bacterium]|nr:HK97 family phage prohead protease [Patescibacteria group bacterium]